MGRRSQDPPPRPGVLSRTDHPDSLRHPLKRMPVFFGIKCPFEWIKGSKCSVTL
jgi:hypothetical protein